MNFKGSNEMELGLLSHEGLETSVVAVVPQVSAEIATSSFRMEFVPVYASGFSAGVPGESEETLAVLSDHPAILERLVRLESEGSKGTPLRDLMTELRLGD